MIRLDDVETGFDDNKRGRPYCVVGWEGTPPHTYALSPRTTRGRNGIDTPAGVLPGLNESGRFVWRGYAAPAAAVEAAPRIGVLPAPYIERVLGGVNLVEFDLD